METVFFYQSYFSVSGSHLDLGSKQFSKKELIIASGQLIFWLVETILSLFFRLLPVAVFFRLVETMFQENPSLRLVETDFRANNGFRNKKKKL